MQDVPLVGVLFCRLLAAADLGYAGQLRRGQRPAFRPLRGVLFGTRLGDIIKTV